MKDPRLMTTTQLPRLLSVKETADYLGVSHGTVRNLLVKGELPGKKIGKAWFINAEHLAAALTEAAA